MTDPFIRPLAGGARILVELPEFVQRAVPAYGLRDADRRLNGDA